MVAVRPAKIEEWQVLRDIRLDALRDAPDSFGSTYAENAALAETDWRRKVSRGGTFFAFVPEVNGTEPSGLVDGFEETPGTVELVSLWVRPQARGLGVGDALVAAVIDWAEKRNAASVHLLADRHEPVRPHALRTLRLLIHEGVPATAIETGSDRGRHDPSGPAAIVTNRTLPAPRAVAPAAGR